MKSNIKAEKCMRPHTVIPSGNFSMTASEYAKRANLTFKMTLNSVYSD